MNNYLQEWKQSCVDPELTQLNVIPLSGTNPHEYLLYSPELYRRNDGRVAYSTLKRYEHIEEGGWWCSGMDILTGKEDMWGCFKPSQPRCDVETGKIIKYEHPPKTPTGIFALKTPRHLWEKIATRYGISLQDSDIQPHFPDFGFWNWVLKHPCIPLCITEGAKKAGALLSAGYVTIGLPGIYSGYRSPKDKQGFSQGKSFLIPQLDYLTERERMVYFLFDQDEKSATQKAVESAIRKTGYLLQQKNCPVKIVQWLPEEGKGIDDFIANHGVSAVDKAYSEALSFDLWKAKSFYQLSVTPDVLLNCRYLPRNIPLAYPHSLIAIKSAKGTGKTRLLAYFVSQAKAENKKILVIGHRVRLVQELCQRFGINYITNQESCQDNFELGYGLCIDSLHPNSQAKFNVKDWKNAVIIIDEVEQVLWHVLNSVTCQEQRIAILKCFKNLIETVLFNGGKVYLSDADLTDISLEYFTNLAGLNLKPFVIINEWKPSIREKWEIFSYEGNTPKKLVKDLERHIQEGGKPFVCLSAQKLTSSWGTCTLEAYFKKQFPDLKILRIDSESLSQSDHPAYGCLKGLNKLIREYDIVLASPSIETGISLDLKGHFTSVWAIAQGVQTVNSICQALGRIRENVPRYIWVSSYGFNKVGNGAISIPQLLNSTQRLTQVNIRLLQQTDLSNWNEFDHHFQAESLLCWAKIGVRVNAELLHYRESVLNRLLLEGHEILSADLFRKKEKLAKNLEEKEPKSLIEVITDIRKQNYYDECVAISSATPITESEYQQLKKKIVKSIEQKRSLRYHQLQMRYNLPITPDLVIRDDQNWYKKLRLHYFLTVGREFLVDRDVVMARKLLDLGEGHLFLPDFNRSQLGAVIGTLDILGLPVLLEYPQRELRNNDPDLQNMAELALKYRQDIKTILGIGLALKSTPMMIIRRLLDLIGYSLSCIRREKQVRVYQLLQPFDDRLLVFQYWLGFDRSSPGGFEQFSDHLPLILPPHEEKSIDCSSIQLSLDF